MNRFDYTIRLPIHSIPAKHEGEARGWAKALADTMPEIVAASDGRVNRAVQILTNPNRPIEADPARRGVFLVKSGSVKHRVYEVDIFKGTCTCPDDRQAQKKGIAHLRRCKHRLAIGIYLYGPQMQFDLILKPRRALAAAREKEEELFEKMCEIIDRREYLAQHGQYEKAGQLEATQRRAEAEYFKAADKLSAIQKGEI